MGLPTLLVPGSLRAVNPADQPALDKLRPVDYIKDWFRSRLDLVGTANRLLVLKSETASGKSTALPPELFNEFVRGGERGMIVTQPRVLTAKMNVAEMIKNYSDTLKLGQTIGWSSKYNKLRPSAVGLLSTTIDTLAVYLKILTDEEIMAKWRFIMIDEVHERSIRADLVFCMLKNFLLRNSNARDCPFVVLMSATFVGERYCDYYKVSPLTNFIICSGRTFGRESHWDWNQDRTVNDYPRAVSDIVRKICQNDDGPNGDLLAFLPGSAQFVAARQHLDKLNVELAQAGKKVFTVLVIDSEAQNIENEDFRKLLQPREDQIVRFGTLELVPARRVILSTNVAETGLTLENLTYVVDSGFNKEIEYNPVYDSRTLMIKPCAKSRITQRMGRAGRKHFGHFYPLYPKWIYDRLEEDQFPQILTDDVLGVMLDIIYEQLRAGVASAPGNRVHEIKFNLHNVDMIDPPSTDACWQAIERLYALGLVSPIAPMFSNIYDVNLAHWERKMILQRQHPPHGWGLTTLGHIAQRMPFGPVLSRMVLAAWQYDAFPADLVTLACLLLEGTRALAVSPATPIAMPMVTEDDFINALMLFRDLKTSVARGSTITTWCERVGISPRAMSRVVAMRDETLEQLYADDFDVFANSHNTIMREDQPTQANINRVRMCIAEGYRCNVLIRNARGEMVTTTGLVVPCDTPHAAVYYRELSLKYNEKTDLYKPSVDMISPAVVAPDLDFLAP